MLQYGTFLHIRTSHRIFDLLFYFTSLKTLLIYIILLCVLVKSLFKTIFLEITYNAIYQNDNRLIFSYLKI